MGSCESTNYHSVPHVAENMTEQQLLKHAKPIIKALRSKISDNATNHHVIDFLRAFNLISIANENLNNLRLLLATVTAGFRTPELILVTWLDTRRPHDMPSVGHNLCAYEILIYKRNLSISYV
jgi:hypothetical protein